MIFYVNEYGEAHTIDQAHELAIKFNTLVDAGLIDQVREFAAAFKLFINDFVEAITEVWEQFKKLGMSWAEMLAQPEKENYRQQMQRQHKRKRQSIVKMYLTNKYNGFRPSDHARFSRSKRKG